MENELTIHIYTIIALHNAIWLGANHNIDTSATFALDLYMNEIDNKNTIWDIYFNLENYQSSVMDIHYNVSSDPYSIINYHSFAKPWTDPMIVGLFCYDCSNLTVIFDGNFSSNYGANGVLASYFGVYCIDQTNTSIACQQTILSFPDGTGVYFDYNQQRDVWRQYT